MILSKPKVKSTLPCSPMMLLLEPEPSSLVKSRSVCKCSLTHTGLPDQNWRTSHCISKTNYLVLGNEKIGKWKEDFAMFLMNQNYKQRLERLQRAGIRVAISWDPNTSESSIYKRIKMTTILERAKDLATTYINRAYQENPSVRETAEAYKISSIRDDGAHRKRTNRLTLLRHVNRSTNP